ncbi:MAG TPA: type I restriction endonuclease [Pseudonocardiaceae bacterium]|nr:type I restriction endonuclease [Pseudonocardiaceae bacterium]
MDDIADRVQVLTQALRKHRSAIETEEATKNAFVMPFISSVLGYDVFNPSEVIPEFVADVGVKKGEKIDYALVHDGQVQVLIEAKKINDQLRLEHASQLYRYFSATKARIAILTNGEEYRFYTDLDKPNLMDAEPFMVLKFSEVDTTLLPELAKLTKKSFNLESVLNAASELKYIGQLKRILATQFTTLPDEWVKFLATQVYSGFFTQKVREQFTPLVEAACRQFLNEQVKSRLNKVLDDDTVLPDEPAEPVVQPQPESDLKGDLVTTDDERQGHRVVQAIVCSEVPAARVVARDTKSYFGVLLDDNNRKPIARLWFNRSKKYLGVFDENKVETRIAIDDVEDIYRHADQLRKTVARYLDNTALADAPLVDGVEST